jgi:acyl-coenzyme A thioesterase PaaI-like protein
MTETLLDVAKRAKASGDLSELGRAIPYARTFGITVDHSSGAMVAHMAFSDEIIGNPILPALHGGTLGALLETTATLQVLGEVETLIFPKIVNITVEFLRSARPADTHARAVITKLGRRIVNVSAEAWQDDPDRPVARAHAHFLIQPIDDAED